MYKGKVFPYIRETFLVEIYLIPQYSSLPTLKMPFLTLQLGANLAETICFFSPCLSHLLFLSLMLLADISKLCKNFRIRK